MNRSCIENVIVYHMFMILNDFEQFSNVRFPNSMFRCVNVPIKDESKNSKQPSANHRTWGLTGRAKSSQMMSADLLKSSKRSPGKLNQIIQTDVRTTPEIIENEFRRPPKII